MNAHVRAASCDTPVSPLAVTDPKIRTQLQLAGLRFLCSRAQWLNYEALLMGKALKSGTMTSDEVDLKLEEMGALDMVYPELMMPVDPVYRTLEREAQDAPKLNERPKPEYQPAKSTIDTFLYWIVRQDEATQKRWLADHPKDAPHLLKLWEAKCKTQKK